MEYINIGNLKLEKTACLAPMAGVADRAYRILNRQFGACYTVSEMISAKGLCYNDKRTEELCRIEPTERPCGLQIFGSEPDFMAKATQICLKFNPDIIDINMGCPVPKVAGNGAGSALMKDKKLSMDIVKAVKSVSDVPVTVKIRSGWDDENINAVEFAEAMELAGADAIAVHGRTRTQYYSGKADWDIIKNVKKSVSIPVLGNGDVDSLEKCLKMYEYTDCDLVMIGRASYGNPWIFKEIDSYFKGIEYNAPSLDEKLEIMLYHIKLSFQDKPEAVAMREARKHTAWYLTGLYGSAQFRARCYSLSSYDEAVKLADDFKNLQKEH